jgi:predicted Rossmann fold flavoprotein
MSRVGETFDVAVLGAGAAGLMCAIEAGKRGRKVVVLEHNGQIGRKILISGGGRCNFTNLNTRPENFLSDNPHFAKSALARYGPEDFLALVRKHAIPYHEKTHGQLFCDGTAKDIVSLLADECAAAGVGVQTGVRIQSIRREEAFHVHTLKGDLVAQSLVVATGGLSIPKIGATAFGYELARQFGLRVLPCRPALVPLTFGAPERERFAELAGVSLEVTVRTGRTEFREKMLFTHRGLSGPAILQASSYWEAGQEVAIDLLPTRNLAALLTDARAGGEKVQSRAFLSCLLPRRLTACFALDSQPVAALSDAGIAAIVREAHDWHFVPAGTEGYEKAEVTAGGIDTAELSSKTFEVKKVPGLFFVGEVLDVTGHLGGFNFQWAWASGHAAGQVA